MAGNKRNKEAMIISRRGGVFVTKNRLIIEMLPARIKKRHGPTITLCYELMQKAIQFSWRDEEAQASHRWGETAGIT